MFRWFCVWFIHSFIHSLSQSVIHSLSVAARGSSLWTVTHIVHHVTCEHMIQNELNQIATKSVKSLWTSFPSKTATEIRRWLLQIEQLLIDFRAALTTHGKRCSQHGWMLPMETVSSHTRRWLQIHLEPSTTFPAPHSSRRESNHFCLLFAGFMCTLIRCDVRVRGKLDIRSCEAAKGT